MTNIIKHLKLFLLAMNLRNYRPSQEQMERLKRNMNGNYL